MYEGILWSEFASFCVSPTNCPCCFVYIPTKCALPEMVHFNGDGPFSLSCFAYHCSNQGTYRGGPLYLCCFVCQCTYGLTEMVHFALIVLCANAYK